MANNRGLSPELQHRLLVAVGVTAQDLARQLREQPDRPLKPMTLQGLLAEERQRRDSGR